MTVAFRPTFNPVPKLLTRHADARQKQRAEEAELRAVYQAVDVRDGPPCRCCGRWTTTRPNLQLGREHHHLQPRSTAAKVEKHTAKNVFVVDTRCHLYLTAGKIRVIGRDANSALAFVWTRWATEKERAGIRLRDERRAA